MWLSAWLWDYMVGKDMVMIDVELLRTVLYGSVTIILKGCALAILVSLVMYGIGKAFSLLHKIK